VDTLRRYAAGTLPPAEEQRIEAHTLDCERCDDLVAGFGMGTPASTDQAVAELRQRLQTRLQQPELRPVVRPWWQPLAAAATLAGLVAGGLWGWQHQQPQTQPEVARTETVAPAGTPPVAAAPAATAVEAEQSTAASTTTAPAAEVAAAPPVAPPAGASAGRASRPAKPAARAASPATTAADAEVAVVLSPVTSPAAAEALPDFALNDEAADKKEEAKDDKAVAAAAPGRVASMKAKSAAAPAAEGSVRRPEPMPPVPAFAAQPLGGMKTLKEYLRRAATEFEPETNTTRLTGMVHLKATVGEDGRLRNVKVTRGLRDDYDAEAERIVCDGPTWTPAISAGRRVPSVVEISVPF
jgi:outer membrane biosynthesis protein TonB